MVCDKVPFGAGAVEILAGNLFRKGWESYSFRGAAPEFISINTCSHKQVMYYKGISTVAGSIYGGVSIYSNPVENIDVSGKSSTPKRLTFDIYLSAPARFTTAAVGDGAADGHEFLFLNGVQIVQYEAGWTHREFDLPSTTKTVRQILFEKQDSGTVDFELDNLAIYP